MSGPRATYRYTVVQSAGGLTMRAFCDVDADSTGLRLAGITNNQAGAVGANATMNFYMPIPSGRKFLNIFARQVKVEFTGALPAGRVNPVTWVVVFNVNTFNSYAVGQVGTFRGLPVVCTDKRDGQPTVTGTFL